MQILNWPHACVYPPDTKGEKGIEEAGAEGLRALIAQFSDPKLPVSFQRLERPDDFQCKYPYY